MQEKTPQKMPTGIASLDPILDGGVPPGSLILLLGDIGAGNYEFAYSSVVNTLNSMRERASEKGDSEKNLIVKEVRYITFTRLEEDVRQEIAGSLYIDGLSALVDTIRFEDLSELYFETASYLMNGTATEISYRDSRRGPVTRASCSSSQM